MCDNICGKEKKILIPTPYFPPPVVEAYPCRTIEVDSPIYEPIIKPVIKNIVQETTINIPKIKYKEKIIEVPKVEYRSVPNVKYIETPIYQDRFKFKDVEVPQKQYKIKPVYKVVDVPEIEYVDKYIEKKYKRYKYVPKEIPIPFRPKREIYTEVPIPRYIPQTIDDIIQQNNLGYPNNIPSPHFNELPIYDENIINEGMINSINPFNNYIIKKEKNKCCLSNLCNSNNKNSKFEESILMNTNLPLINDENIMPFYNNPYEQPFAYSPPFIVEENENNFCNCLIETTSNILAASGIAIILAGKLTIDGINYLVNKNSKDNNNQKMKKSKDNLSIKENYKKKSIEKSFIEDTKRDSLASNQLNSQSNTIDLN